LSDPQRFPIGRFAAPEVIDAKQRETWISEIEELPSLVRQTVASLDPKKLAWTYRPAGWTIRQVVHHLPDSHMNCYVRFRLALTEEEPLIKPYAEAAWAQLHDAETAPVEPSLELLNGLHKRWVLLLRSISEEGYQRKFRHPEMGTRSLNFNLGLYAWHGRHHLAHIQTALKGAGNQA
jgi:hypothetical protein